MCATNFNQPLDWDTSKVTDMGGMFFQARSFNQDLEHWDVSSCRHSWDMFEESGMAKLPSWYE